jgi:hypothetical protein
MRGEKKNLVIGYLIWALRFEKNQPKQIKCI